MPFEGAKHAYFQITSSVAILQKCITSVIKFFFWGEKKIQNQPPQKLITFLFKVKSKVSSLLLIVK